MAESLQPPSAGSAPHVTQPSSSSAALPLPSSAITNTTTTSSPSSRLGLSQTSMASVAARKAALLEKFAGGGSPATWHPDTPANANAWKTGTGLVKERRASLVPAEHLVPAHTGSTIASTATAVESISHLDPPKLATSVSRVRMAIMALDAKEHSAIAVSPAASGRLSRSWSRMSGFTQINEADGDLNARGKWLAMEEGDEGRDADMSTLASGVGVEDGSFDTHPPDMISPRTTLAHVVHPPPPPVRRLTRPWSFTSSPYTMDHPVAIPPPARSTSPLPAPIPEDEPVEDAPEDEQAPAPTLPDTPRAKSSSPSFPAAPRTNTTPIILKGEGRRKVTFPAASPSTANLITRRKVHSRSMSLTPSSSRGLAKTAPASASPLLTTGTRNRPSSVAMMSVPVIVHEGPVVVKAQNQHPLRKVKTSAPRPMRFSVAL